MRSQPPLLSWEPTGEESSQYHDVLCYHEPTLTGPSDHGQQHPRQNKPFYFDHSDRKLTNTRKDMEDVSSSLCLSQRFLAPVFLFYPLMFVELFRLLQK